MRGFIEVVVRDAEGTILKKGRHEMHSFLNNLLRLIQGLMTATGTPWVTTTFTVVNTGGTSTSAWSEGNPGGSSYGGGTPAGAKAPDNDSSYGIVVGSGTTGLALDQYNLASPISHGTGSGQLDYGPSDFTDLGLDTGVTPPVYRFRLLRSFSNLSGAAISITEVGIVARSYWKNASGVANDAKYLVARDVLSTSYSIPNGGTATVTVTIEVEVG
jgi:hypothetical protein